MTAAEHDKLDLSTIPTLVTKTKYFSGFFNFSPDMAKSIINNHMYERQRPISNQRVNQFTNAMDSNNFAPVSTITFSVNNNSFYCVDGQHTLMALVKGNHSLMLPTLIIREKEEVLYSKIDRGKPRTLRDSLKAHNIPNEIGLSPTSTLKVARAVRVIINKYTLGKAPSILIQDENLFQEMRLYLFEAQHFFQLLDSTEYADKLVGQIPLAILLTLYKEINEANWNKIDDYAYGCATDDALPVNDPRKTVYKMYTQYARKGGGGSTRIFMSRHEEMGTLLYAWSKFFKGESIRYKVRAKQMDNILKKSPNLLGTKIAFRSK